MNKARRELAKALARIDVVLEVLDARLPQSSRNPMLAELRRDKPCVALLNKCDLADPEITPAWVRTLNRHSDTLCLETSANQAATVRGVAAACRKLASHRRGPGKTLRCMVVGIPNVGKSTLINTLVGRKIARVGDQPAVTKTQHSYHLDDGISLSDTPGVLWPKLADQQGAYRLAASGAIRDTAFRYMDVAVFAARFLRERYPEALAARFKLETIPQDDHALIEALGRRRGFLRRGGVVDVDRAAEVLLRELRAGKIGRISFETPDDFEPQEVVPSAAGDEDGDGDGDPAAQ